MSHDEAGPIKTFGKKKLKPIFGFNPFDLHDFVDEWFGEWGVSRAFILSVIFAGLLSILNLEISNLPLFALEWLVGTAPVWLPISLFFAMVRVRIWFIQSMYIAGRKPVLLEMKIPREITKSPRAMEIALSNLWLSSGETTFYDRAVKGQVRPFFALEMASFGGEVHFYVWCWGPQRAFVEQAIYGQYPEVELIEVEDYASKFQYDPHKHWCYASDWRKEPHNKSNTKNKKTYGKGEFSRTDCYPIKTYVDYELDKDPKEEFKVDPIATVLELLSALRPDEQIWMSLVLRRCGKYNAIAPSERDDEWMAAVREEIDAVRFKSVTFGDAVKEEQHLSETNRGPAARPSWQQTRMLENMERNLTKLPFEFVGHAVYITTGEPRSPFLTTMRWIWKPYGNRAFTAQLRPRRWHNPFDYPWQDFHEYRRNTLIPRRFFDAYRRRGGFHYPWILPSNVLTNEEIATLWHPPSRSVVTPGLERIPATKAEPPPNLPR